MELLASVFAFTPFWLPIIFCSPASWSLWKLSRKSSDSLLFGDGGGLEPGVMPSKWALSSRGGPAEKLWWTGVLPRDGVKSATR